MDEELGDCFLTEVSRALSKAPENIVGFVGVQTSAYPKEVENGRRPFDLDPTGLMISALVGFDEEGKSLGDLAKKGLGNITVTLGKRARERARESQKIRKQPKNNQALINNKSSINLIEFLGI